MFTQKNIKLGVFSLELQNECELASYSEKGFKCYPCGVFPRSVGEHAHALKANQGRLIIK